MPQLKQTRLANLSGVVILEDLRRQHQQLKNPEVTQAEKVRVLKSLASKKPSTDILIETGIGKTVRKLSKQSSDPEVAQEAEKVYQLWLQEVEKRETLIERGPLEVLCDLKTQNWREKCREFLRASLLKESSSVDSSLVSELAGTIEKELFDQCQPLKNSKARSAYGKTARRIIFANKNNSKPVIKGEITPRKLVKTFRNSY